MWIELLMLRSLNVNTLLEFLSKGPLFICNLFPAWEQGLRSAFTADVWIRSALWWNRNRPYKNCFLEGPVHNGPWQPTEKLCRYTKWALMYDCGQFPVVGNKPLSLCHHRSDKVVAIKPHFSGLSIFSNYFYTSLFSSSHYEELPGEVTAPLFKLPIL